MSNTRSKFVLYKDSDSKWNWRLVVRGQAVAHGTRSYPSKGHARKAVESFTNHAAIAATVVDE